MAVAATLPPNNLVYPTSAEIMGSQAPANTANSSPTSSNTLHSNSSIESDEVEHIFHTCLSQSNKLAKSDEAVTQDIATAKMLNYCIRMLHANGWHPTTVLHAMALRESGSNDGESMRGTMYQALREQRDKANIKRELAKALKPTDDTTQNVVATEHAAIEDTKKNRNRGIKTGPMMKRRNGKSKSSGASRSEGNGTESDKEKAVVKAEEGISALAAVA